MTNVNIENQLVQLEGLINGYQELLSEAKAQLETLDVDETKLNAVARELATQPAFKSALASSTAAFVVRTVANDEDSEIIERVADRIYQRVLCKLKTDLEKPVTDVVTELANSDVIEQKFLQMLANRKEFAQLCDMATAMNKVINIAKELD